MKYLFLDHMGVLNQALNSVGEVNEPVIECLTQLVNDYGYTLLFQSSNTLEGQLDLLERLKSACLKKKKYFPAVKGLAVRDLQTYPNISSEKPMIIPYKEGLIIAAFGHKKGGKTCLREALCYMLTIQKEELQNSIVFDDELAYITQAQKEGYQVKYITPSLSFQSALEEVLMQNKQK